jgi:hypothetical protein
LLAPSFPNQKTLLNIVEFGRTNGMSGAMTLAAWA